jgi:hypothetical protein
MFLIVDCGLLGCDAVRTSNLRHVLLCKVIPGIWNRSMNICAHLVTILYKKVQKPKLITFNLRHYILHYNHVLMLVLYVLI